jgi:RND family efflux transporter MFP subunit
VQVVLADPASYRAQIKTQGTIIPHRQINLVTEVSGRVTRVAEDFAVGGAFEEGQLLVELDERDYRYALVNAESQVASAERELALEKGQARQAKREWRDLGSAEANALSLRQPQVRAAEAALASARAERDRAFLNLQRSKIKAPFGGRVETKQVDLGQFLTVGSVLGTIYDSSVAEVRLPLSNDQLALTDFVPGQSIDAQSTLTLSANIGGQDKEWIATLARLESSVDSTTRFYHIIAEVDQPFNMDIHSQPLLMGLFVEATLPGRQFENVIRLPKKALIDSQIFIVDEDDTLRLREITIVDQKGDFVWLQSSLEQGDRIVVSDPRVLRSDMKVRVKLKDEAKKRT